MAATDSAEPAAEAEGELASFIPRWAEAIVTNEVERIAAFTAENWILIDRPGVISRQAFHDVVAAGELRHDRMTHEVLGIDRYGPVAVVRTHCCNTGSFQGQPIEADEWTTNLLVQGPEGWRCVLTQLTPRDRSAPE
ncbi:hypothetical protein GCM10022261_07210 [Brevibacterium daeguense]|uniref:DUF4440 domain-containing protein n=1 Tax=Brevibacterium daeguense TaxID=909936 RepID=A0ABP8EGX2_9MICO|nr:nuclear transport factor 2 family protein [Brevibacterium daeguense]